MLFQPIARSTAGSWCGAFLQHDTLLAWAAVAELLRAVVSTPLPAPTAGRMPVVLSSKKRIGTYVTRLSSQFCTHNIKTLSFHDPDCRWDQ